MWTQGRGVRSVSAVILALAAGCGARGGGGPIGTADVPSATDDRGGAMDGGAPPADTGAPDDRGVAADTGVVAMDAAGCVASGAEGTAGACSDGADNDCDGFSDCTEPECERFCGATTDSGPPVDRGAGCVRTGEEGTNAACADGLDNDCDGYTDCVDFSCSMAPAVTLCPRDAGPPDAGCVRTGAEDTPAACADRVDNDCDGYLDCRDFNCQRASVPFCPSDAGAPRDARCVATSENTNGSCSDGVDNDCDGYTDCIDRSCTNTCVVTICPSDGGARDAGSCVCRGAESSASACRNGVDDDCDGFVDCGDFDCSMNNPAVAFCRDGG